MLNTRYDFLIELDITDMFVCTASYLPGVRLQCTMVGQVKSCASISCLINMEPLELLRLQPSELFASESVIMIPHNVHIGNHFTNFYLNYVFNGESCLQNNMYSCQLP